MSSSASREMKIYIHTHLYRNLHGSTIHVAKRWKPVSLNSSINGRTKCSQATQWMYSSIKGNKVLIYATFHLHEEPTTGKSIKQMSGRLGPRGWGNGE